MIMMRAFLILGVVALADGQALAQEPDALGTFSDWEAYAYKANGAKVCFAFSKPSKSEASKKVRRDEVHVALIQPGPVISQWSTDHVGEHAA